MFRSSFRPAFGLPIGLALLAGLILILLLFPGLTWAQEPINATPFTYNQNFDYVNATTGLNRSGTLSWTNNTTIRGWYLTQAVTPPATPTITANAGTMGTGGFYSYGANTSATSRALGGVQTNGTGAMSYGLRLQNQTASTFRSLTLTFSVEQWRNSGETAPQVMYFMYRIANSALTTIDASTTDFEEYYEMNPFSPVNNGAAGALTGDNAPNRVTITATLEVNLPADSEMMLKWVDPNDGGLDHGLALDDVSLTLGTAAPAFETVTNGGNFSDYFDQGVEPKIVNQQLQANFLKPTTAQLNTFGTGFDQAATNNYAGAYTTLAGVNYKLIRYSLPEATYTVVRPTSTSGIYWGFYYLNPTAQQPNLALQVPHPLKDFRTPRQGSYLFEEMQAFFLGVSGHHRCMSDSASTCKGKTDACNATNTLEAFRVSDPAHNVRNFFHRATTVLAPRFLSLHFLQLHGFGQDADDPHFIISNGTYLTPNPDRVKALGDKLAQTPPTSVYPTNATLTYKTAHLLPDTADKLLATTNVQGRFLNGYAGNVCTGGGTSGQVSNRFTHLEQYYDFRADARNYPTLKAAVQQMLTVTPTTLPVELTSFRAKATERQVLLTWTVASEKDNATFTVERSTDAENYRPIGTVAGAGTSSTARSYALTDDEPLAGLTYYRLRQTDRDGTTRYTGLTTVNRRAAGPSVLVYPTPTDGRFTVAGAAPGGTLALLNALGNTVRTYALPRATTSIDATDLRRGLYFARVTDAQGRVLGTQRLVIE